MNALRGPVLPTLLAVGIAAASVVGTIALTHKHSSTAAGPTTPPPVHNAAWTVDGAQNAPSLSALTGFWIGTDVVVRGSVDGLHAMKRSDGTSAWDLPTPTGGNVCGMSAAADSKTGIGIVVSQGTTSGVGSCDAVSAIDIASGKTLWTKDVSAEFGSPEAGAADYGIASGIAVVDSDQNGSATGVIGLDLGTGTVKWRHSAGCDHRPDAFAVTGGRIALAEACQDQTTVRVLDAATGDPVPGVTPPSVAGTPHPRILSADPLAIADDGSAPKALAFGSGAPPPPPTPPPTAVSNVDKLFSALGANGPSRAQITVGKDVLCVGGRIACWTARGAAVSPRGLPNDGAAHHNVHVVTGAGDAARVVTGGLPGHPRASLCRIAADGTATVEADLSQPVSDYVGDSGSVGSFYAYGDAKDLYLVSPNPVGQTAVIDVRLG